MAAAHRRLGGALLVLDDASMVGTVQMRVLMRIAERTGVVRLALVGDRRQLRAVEAGQPFALLQGAGRRTTLRPPSGVAGRRASSRRSADS